MAAPTYVTVEEAAQTLRCHPATIRRLLRRGELAGRRVGSTWRVSADDLQPLLEPRPLPKPRTPRRITGEFARLARDVADAQDRGRAA